MFDTAQTIFWFSISVWRRALTDQERIRLLAHVDKYAGTRFSDSPQYVGSWHGGHEFVLKRLRTRLLKYVEEWLASPAGVAYMSIRKKHQYGPRWMN